MKKIKTKLSFTLMEVVIVISIMGIVTVAVFQNRTDSKKNMEVLHAAKKMELAIRKVQNEVISAKSEELGGTYFVPCSRGILTRCAGSDDYLIGYERMNPLALACNTNYILSTFNVNEIENLGVMQDLGDNKIRFDFVDVGGSNQCGVSLIFVSPDNDFYADGQKNQLVEINIADVNGGSCNLPVNFCRIVKINPFGQVSIE